ncbi:hypothetical protein D3C83_16010 [compost metagenome]
MGHDLAHELHEFKFESLFDRRMGFQEAGPLLHGQFGHPHLGDGADRIRYGGLQAPGGIARVDIAFSGEAQDHFLALGVRHHALQDALDDEILLHGPVALMLEQVALRVVGDFEQRLEFAPLRGLDVLEDEVLPQLNADDLGFGMECEQGHDGGRGLSAAAEEYSEFRP